MTVTATAAVPTALTGGKDTGFSVKGNTAKAAALTAAKPAAKRTAKPAAKPANPVLTPEQVEQARIMVRVSELKSAYVTALDTEKGKKKAIRAAREAWEDSRVITSRVMFTAAMLKPLEDGSPNRTFAARNMHMTDAQNELTGEDLVKATKSAKSTIKNYIDAGIALQAAGLSPMGEGDKGNFAAPTKAEREIVAAAFKAGNVRNTVTNPGAGTTADSAAATGEAGSTETLPDPLTFADLSGHLGRLENTLKLMIAANVAVTPEQARHAMAALGTLAMTLSEYAGLEPEDA